MNPRWFAACLAVAAAPLFAAKDPVCPAGQPLGGHVELRFRYSPENHTRTARLRAWFDLVPEQRQGMTYLAQRWTATDMLWRTDSSSCVDKPDPDNETCRCKPRKDKGKTSFDAADRKPEFHALYPELHVPVPTAAAESLIAEDFRCQGASSGSAGPSPLPVDYTYHVVPREIDLPAIRVKPSGCLDEDERVTPECAKAIKKFAVLPFRGSGELEESEILKTRVLWEVCCGCGEPPRGEAEGETDPCGDAKQQRGLLEVSIARSVALRNDLRPRLERYKFNREQANNYRSDFELVSSSCAGWDIAMTLLTALIGGAGAPKGAGALTAADEAAQAAASAFTQLLEIMEKVLDGDPTVILSGVEGAEIDLLGVKGFTLGSLWGPASEIYQLIGDAKDGKSIANMKQRLEDCAGVPLVSDPVYKDAGQYLDFLEAAAREVPAIEKLTTRIQQSDTDVYEKWVKYYTSCLEEAQCRGTDPKECQPEP
jgi:hypothetical protein